ncbi:ABC transporter ATP-binding protein [Acetobacter sp. DsW_063]|uniref:ABC transporter ATP-binding protein n=1 Tax=Acetobacter sp. DsW_063 TaxID=1514894 RepID=UPI000A38429B|nr:ABC transporter ATP-binding protein [Acetobacter sp. DsW_063]OUJ12326.1 iron ABC transporter ATP-binding protein [Acetobacter sp. DsW_063]
MKATAYDPLTAGPLTISYGRRRILDGVTVGPLPPGSITALLGSNGSGKSTLLGALAGLKASDGAISLGDIALGTLALPERARYCAYMPQTLPPPIRMQTLETVLVAMRTDHSSRRSNHIAHALKILSDLGIASLAHRYLDELSGGQRQLAGLAQALARSPRVLLLDEPLSALDLRHQFEVMDVLRGETASRGMITVIVLHDLGVALRRADQAMLLADGHVVSAGPVSEVVTPEHLRRAFGVEARIEISSDGRPMLLVDGVA